MTTAYERLQQLLDGDLDPSEIADDPALVSLADRLYGIKIAPVQPVKARDMVSEPAIPVTEVAPPTDMLVEVIAPVSPTGNVPLPAGPLPSLELPPVPARGSRSPLRWFALAGLVVCVMNVFGAFSSLFNGTCAPGVCRGAEQTRINWLSVHQVGESDGWSYSLLSSSMDGVGGIAGGVGIPDIVAIGVLLIAMILLRRKR